MSLHALNIPDDPARLPGWLEEQITGLDLALLADELAAIHAGTAASTATLDEALEGNLKRVLAEGMGVLSPESLRRLLVQPALLLELQEHVLIDGGPCWDRTSPRLEREIDEGRRRLKAYLAFADGPTPPPSVPFYRRNWFVALATAAAVLLAVKLLLPTPGQPGQVVQAPPAAPGWGWAKPGALPEKVSAREYLDALAAGGDAWFKKRPDDAAGLARRINEFRQGCSVLILASHQPLDPADRAWLVERCRETAAGMDAQLRDLESGVSPAAVRERADALVRSLVEGLKERASRAAA